MPTDEQRKELAQKVSALVQQRFDGDYAKAFAHYDGDGDGRVGRQELISLLDDADVGNRLTRGAWADGVIGAVDKDKDGAISQAELEAVLHG